MKQYTDYTEMIITETPELVAICTESGKHAEIALFCIEHGCNCIIEKPIALSIADADAIIATSIKNDSLLEGVQRELIIFYILPSKKY